MVEAMVVHRSAKLKVSHLEHPYMLQLLRNFLSTQDSTPDAFMKDLQFASVPCVQHAFVSCYLKEKYLGLSVDSWLETSRRRL